MANCASGPHHGLRDGDAANRPRRAGASRYGRHLTTDADAEQAYRRVARLGDGWMTTFKSPEDVQTSLAMIREYARQMGCELKPDFEVAIYHNINVDEDRDGHLPRPSGFSTATTRSISARTCSSSGWRPVRLRNAF